MKLGGLGLTALLVFSGVTLGALPAFAPTSTSLTVRNDSTKPSNVAIYHKPVITPHVSTPTPKPAKHP